MRRLTELVVAEVLDVSHVQAADAVHLAEVPYCFRDVVILIRAERAGAEAYCVAGRIVQGDDFVKIFDAVRNARQAEDRPSGVVGVAGHYNAALLAGRDDAVEEVFVILAQLVRADVLVQCQYPFKLRKALGFPAGKREAVAVFNGALDYFERPHAAELRLVKVQAVRAVLGDDTGKVGAQPVEYRHEVIDDDLDAVLGEVSYSGAVVCDVLIARGQTELDVLMDVDGFDDLALEPSRVDFIDVALYLVLVPDLARGLIVQKAHDTGHAGDLLYLFECNAVTV